MSREWSTALKVQSVFLIADDFEETVALNDLIRDEIRLLQSGDEVEYACDVGGYEVGSVTMINCGTAEHGGAGAGILGDAAPILDYWSLPALVIASVLTVTAMARSTWRGWQPPMVAVMCLGVLAILNASATVVFNYTTVNPVLILDSGCFVCGRLLVGVADIGCSTLSRPRRTATSSPDCTPRSSSRGPRSARSRSHCLP